MRISLVLSCLFILSAALSAAHFYVSPEGSDKNPGSAKAPFATIRRAAEKARPGDTVKIGPGLYREQKVLPSPSSGPEGPKVNIFPSSNPPEPFSPSGLLHLKSLPASGKRPSPKDRIWSLWMEP